VGVANPRVPAGYLDANPWATLTGGQRDDDADGYGNRCDAKFSARGVSVATSDLAAFLHSRGQQVDASTCGRASDARCASYDLDETGDVIDDGDLRALFGRMGLPPGPTCAACPIDCTGPACAAK